MMNQLQSHPELPEGFPIKDVRQNYYRAPSIINRKIQDDYPGLQVYWFLQEHTVFPTVLRDYQPLVIAVPHQHCNRICSGQQAMPF